jgi:DNA-binding transcriptional LysR family regulator
LAYRTIIDLKHLQAFVTVADDGTVSKAAARLHIAQPALSRQIIDLEAELGLALFHRVGRRVRLTGEGEQLLASCRGILAGASSLGDQAAGLRTGDRGILKVTGSPQMIDNIYSGLLPRYQRQFPKVDLRLLEGIGADVLAKVERGDAHLGTVAHEVVPKRAHHFGSLLLLAITFRAAYAEPFALGDAAAIEVSALRSYPLLLLDPTFALRKTFDAACRLAQVRPDVRFECSSPHTLLSLAEAGHGVAVVPSNVLLHRYTLKIKKITARGEPLQEPLSIFWDNRRALPPYTDAFCDLLVSYIREVIEIP